MGTLKAPIIPDLALKNRLMVILMYSIMGRNNGTLKAPIAYQLLPPFSSSTS